MHLDAPEELLKARMAPDVLPFAYQVKSTTVHSRGALEGVRNGVFSPDMTRPPDSFNGLKARVVDTLGALQAIAPSEVDGWLGRDIAFTDRNDATRCDKGER